MNAHRPKNARNWSVHVERCQLTEGECASFTLPSHVRYAVWSLDADTFRAYIEFDIPVKRPRFREFPDAQVTHAIDMTRDAKKHQVACADRVWEYGRWERKARKDAVGGGGRDGNIVEGARDESAREEGEYITALEARIKELETLLADANDNKPVMTTNNTNNTTNNNTTTNNHNNNVNINLTINNFGDEDTSHISDATLKQRFLAMGQGIIDTIKDVHMNDIKPENKNVRMASMRNMVAESHAGGVWVRHPVSRVVDMLIFNGYKLNSRPYRTDPEFHDYIHAVSNSDSVIEFMTDMLSVKQVADRKKANIVKTRQGVRAMVIGLPKKATGE